MRLKRILDMVTGEETFQLREKKLRGDDDELQQDDTEMNDDLQQESIKTKDVATINDNKVSIKVVKQDLVISNEFAIKESDIIKNTENHQEEKSEKLREPFFSNKEHEEFKSIYDEEFYNGVELEENSKGNYNFI